MNTSFLHEEELKRIPFRSIGKGVLISRKCSLYSPEEIIIGDHVRIDDFCVLSGNIRMGSFIHVSAYTALYGKFGIVLEDYVTISARVLVFSQNDDYSGDFMTNPMIPEKFRNVSGGLVTFGQFSIVGAGSIVLPGVTIQEGAAVGAMSLIVKDIPQWSLAYGIPAVPKKSRNQNIINIVNDFKRGFAK